MQFFFGALGALLGAVVTGFVSYRLLRSKFRADISVALLTEFYSPELYKQRRTFGHALERFKERDFNILYCDKMSDEEQQAAVRVLHYFERVVALDNANALDRQLTRDTLGRLFSWWFDNALVPLSNNTPAGEWREVLNRSIGLQHLATTYKPYPRPVHIDTLGGNSSA